MVDLGAGRIPIYVALVDDTLALVREPYYTTQRTVADRGNGRFEALVTEVPASPGESLAEALAEGGALRKILSSIDRDREYVALLVDGSSFASFRQLRPILREQGIPFGWEPRSTPVFQFSASGQLVGEEK